MSNLKVIEFPQFEDELKEIVDSESEISDNICSILINNTPNVDKNVKLLTKNWFKTIFEKYQKLMCLIFKINDEIDHNFDLKSVLLCLGLGRSFILSFQSSLGEHQSKTCWKVRKCDKFHSLYVDDDSSECITTFVHEILIGELKNERSGILENFRFKEKVRLPEIGDEDGQNLLLLAVLKGKQEAVQKLLNHEFDADEAINQAWKSYLEFTNDNDEDKNNTTGKIVLELLKSNSRIPNDFDYDRASESVKNFINKCESMHCDVTEDRFDDLKIKLDSEPNLVHSYNRENQSLLDCALKKNKYEIFDYLDRGLTIGSHEDLEILYENLGSDEAKSLRKTNQQNSKIYEENYLLVLKLNCRIGNNDQQHHKRWNLIEEALITINKNSYCRKILKVAAECKKLKIYFDFKHDSTYYLDPASSVYSQGIIYTGGSIFIGAKHLKDETSKFHVFGVLVHELCHLATLLTFMNPNFDPFPVGESQEKTRFDSQVMVECNLKKNLNQKVENVFISYRGSYQNSEMIVTYPQILMTYFGDQKKIEKFEEDFKELVKYSKEIVEPELDKALNVFKILNDKERIIKFKQLTVSMKARIVHSKIKFHGVETTIFELIGNDQQILKCLRSEDIRKLLIKGEKISIGSIDEQKQDFSVERHFLDQNQKKDLDKLKNDNIEYINFCKENRKTFDQICNETRDSKVFILSDHAGTGKTTFFNFAATKLKQDYKNHWVSVINLRKLRSTCMNITHSSSKEEVLSILLEMVNAKSEIEEEIFTKLFSKGKVIFLFDGFDEVSPSFTKQTLCIFKHLKNGTSNQNGSYKTNQLWISTRPHYASKLEEVLNTVTHSFTPFSFEEKKEIINKILIVNNIQNEEQQLEIMNKVLNVVFKRVNTSLEIDNIMMIQIIAELHINNNSSVKNFNLNNRYELYSAMIELQKDITGEKIPNSVRDNDSKLTVWDVHRVLALILIFGDDFQELFEIDLNELSIVKKWQKDKKNWTSDKIQRYGFVVVNLEDPDERNSVEFIHRTYAEFFVAQYIIKSMYENDDDTSDAEIERIIHLFLTVTRNYKEFDRIDIFVTNFLISKKKDKQVHEKVKKLFYPKVIEAHNTLAGPIYYETHRFFREYYLPISCIDPEMFWNLDKEESLLEELIFSDINIYDVTLMAEISLGTNWHEIFNKSGIKLITDAEIDQMPAREDNEPSLHSNGNFNQIYGSNFDKDKNYLKLCDLVYKTFSKVKQIMFFKNINVMNSFIRSSIQCAIIQRMQSVLTKESFTITIFKSYDASITSSKTLEFVFKCIDELFENHQDLLRQFFFDPNWCRWSSPLIKSFRVFDLEIFELTVKFYKKYKTSWNEIRSHLSSADAEDFLYPVDSLIYSAYREFIEEVFESDTKMIAEKIDKYLCVQSSNRIAISIKCSENNFKNFLLYIFSNDEKKVEKIMSGFS